MIFRCCEWIHFPLLNPRPFAFLVRVSVECCLQRQRAAAFPAAKAHRWLSCLHTLTDREITCMPAKGKQSAPQSLTLLRPCSTSAYFSLKKTKYINKSPPRTTPLPLAILNSCPLFSILTQQCSSPALVSRQFRMRCCTQDQPLGGVTESATTRTL